MKLMAVIHFLGFGRGSDLHYIGGPEVLPPPLQGLLLLLALQGRGQDLGSAYVVQIPSKA